jgi:hypothetical protein
MHGKPGRLVDHQSFGVFEQNSVIPHAPALPFLLHRRNVCARSVGSFSVYAELTF